MIPRCVLYGCNAIVRLIVIYHLKSIDIGQDHQKLRWFTLVHELYSKYTCRHIAKPCLCPYFIITSIKYHAIYSWQPNKLYISQARVFTMKYAFNRELIHKGNTSQFRYQYIISICVKYYVSKTVHLLPWSAKYLTLLSTKMRSQNNKW